MSEKHIHIVSFDIPWPANYGGVIDVFYKALALSQIGVKVHLHCYEYGRPIAPDMNNLFYKVYYYKRDLSITRFFSKIPYIVSTRNNKLLIKNLLNDDYPILMEGLHTTVLLNDKRFINRKKIVRTHNIEHFYYSSLSNIEKNIVKKIYFHQEAAKLKQYEKVLDKADNILALSKEDFKYFSEKYNNVSFVPAFHQNNKVNIITGRGDYVLYHGHLAVPENENAVRFLASHIFKDLKVPFYVAGLNPSKKLLKFLNSFQNVKVFPNPSYPEMLKLVQNAQINMLVTFQVTGLKLKLLNSLYSGRFVIVNDKMIKGSGLESFCERSNKANDLKESVVKIMKKEFSLEMKEVRSKGLKKMYDNIENAKIISDIIF